MHDHHKIIIIFIMHYQSVNATECLEQSTCSLMPETYQRHSTTCRAAVLEFG